VKSTEANTSPYKNRLFRGTLFNSLKIIIEMQFKFLGAVRTVTGSMHLLESDGGRLLLDCGLFQGPREESEAKNRNFPFDPQAVEVLLLSHAHIDHSGNIPSLVKNGFNGSIFATFATRDLCSVMLRDSAHVLAKDVEFVNKKRAHKGLPPKEPLYQLEDVEKSLPLFVGYSYERAFFPLQGVRAIFYDAGHILGSSLTLLEVEEKGEKKRVLFTGDLGRKGLPILRDPAVVDGIDYLIIESTYGNRYHSSIEDTVQELEVVVKKTFEKNGKIIIPAYSVGRTQEIVYELHNIIEKKRIPELPVFVDSPLSVNVTEIFKLHPECYDEETKRILMNHEDPFGFKRLTYITKVEDSKKLNNFGKPCIIISASGMCEAGRILHHLANSIEDPKNTVLIVGYQAQGTLGKRLVNRGKKVRIFGEEYHLRAEVVVLNGFSAHADREELLDYVRQIRSNLKGVFIVHGDLDQSEALADGLRSLGQFEVYVPEIGEEVTL